MVRMKKISVVSIEAQNLTLFIRLSIAMLYKNIIIMFYVWGFFSGMIYNIFNFAGQSYSAGYKKRG